MQHRETNASSLVHDRPPFLYTRTLGSPRRMNPGGSVKDRAALYLVTDAEKRGALKPGGTVVEGDFGTLRVSCVAGNHDQSLRRLVCDAIPCTYRQPSFGGEARFVTRDCSTLVGTVATGICSSAAQGDVNSAT